MSDRPLQTSFLIRIVLIVVGLGLLLDIITLPALSLPTALVLFFAGLLFISLPGVNKVTLRLGIGFFLLGGYAVLRDLAVIETSWLGYILGASLVLLGAVQFIKEAEGGAKEPPATGPDN